MQVHDLIAGIAIAVGLLGIVVVFLPGLPLETLAVVLWAFEDGTGAGTVAAAVSIVIAVAVTILKYLRPGRKLRDAGVARTHLFLALLAGILGFFLIPVVGGPLLFVVAIYLLQRFRVGPELASNATRAALGAIALSIGIELAGGFLIAAMWLGAVLLG
jgi:hypothetical protein